MVELPENRVQILVDVSVIKFEIVDDEPVRPVVHKLGTFVEERCIVFISFDNEALAAAVSCGDAEIRGDATDKKPGFQAGLFEDPCQHTRSRRFAMRAGNGKNLLAA